MKINLPSSNTNNDESFSGKNQKEQESSRASSSSSSSSPLTKKTKTKQDRLLLDARFKVQFPWKLHRLLEESEEKGFDKIISWESNGKSFKVHCKEQFACTVMPHYFQTNKFKSFQRSLNFWGFHTCCTGREEKGCCFHPLFVRGQPNLCHLMERTKIKNSLLSTNNQNHNHQDTYKTTTMMTATSSAPSRTTSAATTTVPSSFMQAETTVSSILPVTQRQTMQGENGFAHPSGQERDASLLLDATRNSGMIPSAALLKARLVAGSFPPHPVVEDGMSNTSAWLLNRQRDLFVEEQARYLIASNSNALLSMIGINNNAPFLYYNKNNPYATRGIPMPTTNLLPATDQKTAQQQQGCIEGETRAGTTRSLLNLALAHQRHQDLYYQQRQRASSSSGIYSVLQQH